MALRCFSLVVYLSHTSPGSTSSFHKPHATIPRFHDFKTLQYCSHSLDNYIFQLQIKGPTFSFDTSCLFPSRGRDRSRGSATATTVPTPEAKHPERFGPSYPSTRKPSQLLLSFPLASLVAAVISVFLLSGVYAVYAIFQQGPQSFWQEEVFGFQRELLE